MNKETSKNYEDNLDDVPLPPDGWFPEFEKGYVDEMRHYGSKTQMEKNNIEAINLILKMFLKQKVNVEINPYKIKEIDFSKIDEDHCFVMLVSDKNEVINLEYGKKKINLFDIPPELITKIQSKR